MSFEADANKKAALLDGAVSYHVSALKLESAKKLFFMLRNYLVEQARTQSTFNDVYSKIKLTGPDVNGFALITLGPTIDKGPSSEHFVFDSGARLSLAVAVHEKAGLSELITLRFHYHFPDGHSPAYLRFDLNKASHSAPLAEPRSHLHPGLKNVRVPIPVLHPVEVLDRVFFVLEPSCK